MCSPQDFKDAREGYYHNRDNQISVQRFAAYRIHQSLVQKPLTIEQFWPMSDHTEPEKKEIDQETWDRIKRLHKVK